MNYFADFDRYVIGECNDGRGMRTLRLRRRLRKNGEAPSGLRPATFVSESTLPLLGGAGLAG